MSPDAWSGARRVVVVRLDNIGDVVLTSPALRALARRLPDARVTLMASPAGAQAAPLLPWLDDVMVVRSLWQDVSGAMPLDPSRELRLVEEVRRRDFDVALVLTSFSQSPHPPAYVAYLAGVPVRVGQSAEFAGGVLSHAVPPLAREAHQADRNLHLLAETGVPSAGSDLELRVPMSVAWTADRRLAEAGVAPGDPFVLHAPGAGCPARTYPLEGAAAVARELARRSRLPVVVVARESERAEVERHFSDAPGVHPLIGRLSVPELAAAVARASLVVCNDSGPLHLADALGTPVAATFSGTDLASQWEPRAVPARLLRRPASCSPCYRYDCPNGMACLDVPPHEVAAGALALLGSGIDTGPRTPRRYGGIREHLLVRPDGRPSVARADLARSR